jgi:pyruvate kinase
MDTGMNVARFNFSHGDHEAHGRTLTRLRKVAQEKSRNTAVLLDTKGPEIRSGFFSGGQDKIVLVKGETIRLTADYSYKGDKHRLACSYPKIAASVTQGQQILVADGSLVLRVLECDIPAGEVLCRIENNATIGERKNMNLPGVEVDLPTFTDKDKDDIVNFGIKNRVEFIAASFVRTAQDVMNLRKLLNDNGGSQIKIISKIENLQGLQNYDAILAVTDGVMVARGDLGMEIPSSKVFLAQKMMIRGANIAGKPIITATQMLESMINSPRPTRAECSDVANAVYDGTDAVMLSGETANGGYFREAVDVMARTCCEAEQSRNYNLMYHAVRNSIVKIAGSLTHGESLASSAVKTAIDVEAKLILVMSETGKMANYVAKFRPGVPIMCLIPNLTSARQASGLLQGVHTILVDSLSKPEELLDEVNFELVKSGMLKVGDLVVFIGGRMSGLNEQLRINGVTEGKSHGHFVMNSDEFFYNPKLILSYGK